MCDKDRDSLRVEFNTVYYIAKHEKVFTDYPNLLELQEQEKNNVQGIDRNYITDCATGVFNVIGNSIKIDMKRELKSLRFYSILSDGRTDSGKIKEELVYVINLIFISLDRV